VESKNIAFEVFGFPGFLEPGKPRKPLKTWKLICQITDAGRESRTGTRLVSPASGRKKKKKDVLRTGVQNAKLSALEHITVPRDGIESSATSRHAVKQFK